MVGHSGLAHRIAAYVEALGLEVFATDPPSAGALDERAVAGAHAVILADEDDVKNLACALAVRDAAPSARVVVRMFNTELGAQLESLVPNCRVLSSSRIAAPAFIAAAEALSSASSGRRRARAGAARMLLRGLGRDPRLKVVGAAVGVMIAVSSAIFSYFHELSLTDAFYFTVSTVTTTGFGDINLHGADWWLKLFGAALMLLGAGALAAGYALITDALVSTRIAHALGAVPRGINGHVIVAGLGTVGFRVTQQLDAAGIDVVAVERDEDGRFVAAARALGIPVVVGDASLPQTLAQAQAAKACCLLAVTDSDIANLEAALNVRSVAPGTAVVLRIFEPDLAVRVERTLGITSRSVADLAAPIFVEAALAPVVAEEARAA